MLKVVSRDILNKYGVGLISFLGKCESLHGESSIL